MEAVGRLTSNHMQDTLPAEASGALQDSVGIEIQTKCFISLIYHSAHAKRVETETPSSGTASSATRTSLNPVSLLARADISVKRKRPNILVCIECLAATRWRRDPSPWGRGNPMSTSSQVAQGLPPATANELSHEKEWQSYVDAYIATDESPTSMSGGALQLCKGFE
jgi:hypothetical protein